MVELRDAERLSTLTYVFDLLKCFGFDCLTRRID